VRGPRARFGCSLTCRCADAHARVVWDPHTVKCVTSGYLVLQTYESEGIDVAGGRLAWAGVLQALLPGWVLLVGTVASLLLFDRTEWSSVPFLIAVAIAMALLRLAPARAPHEEAGATGPQSWFSAVGDGLGLRSDHLREQGEAAGLNPERVTLFARLPWWLVLAFWAFLVVYAVYDLGRAAVTSAF